MRGWEISQSQDPGWLFWSMIGLLDGILTGIPSIELSQSLFASSENRESGWEGREHLPPLASTLHYFYIEVCLHEVHPALTLFDRSHTAAPGLGQGPATAWLAQLVHTQVLCIIESQQSCLLSFSRPLDQSTRGPTGNSSLKLSLSTSSTSAGLLLSSSLPPCPRPASPS